MKKKRQRKKPSRKLLQKSLPDDLVDETIRETFRDMWNESQIVPTLLTFPKEVIEVLEAYEREHSIDRDHLLGVAIKATIGREDLLAKTIEHYMEDSDSFRWPLEDPLQCLLIGYIRKHASLWTENISRKLGDDKPDQADWWKRSETP